MFNNNGNKRNAYEDSLQILFESTYRKVYLAAYSILLDSEMAKDAAQEAYLRAFKSINTLREKSKFQAWVCSIAINTSKDMLRDKIKQRKHRFEPINNPSEGIKLELENILIDYNLPDDIYEKGELRREIMEILNSLKEIERQIIILKYYQDLSYDEIAAILNTKIGTVKSTFHRSKSKILRKLKNIFYYPIPLDKEDGSHE